MASPVKVTPAQYRKYGVNGTLRLSTGFFQRYFESDGTTTEVPILQVSLARKLVEGMAGWPDSCLRLRLTDGAFHYSEISIQPNRTAIGKKLVTATAGISNYDNNYNNLTFVVNSRERSVERKDFSWLAAWRASVTGDNLVGNAENGGEINREVARPSAPRRQPQSFGSGNVTPIAMITPYISKWRICGLCTAKDELKTTKARSGAGDMKSYYISGGTVKQANKRFNTTGHDYELSMNATTEIAPCHDQIPKPALVLKICPLQNIPSHKDEFVDVLAVVDKMDPVNKLFRRRQGRECVKRDIQLIDQTGTVVQFTLWGEHAENFEDHALGPVIFNKRSASERME
ncbi:hypothetical protein OSTOST_24734, partial [Ostertagia ostertagi]